MLGDTEEGASDKPLLGSGSLEKLLAEAVPPYQAWERGQGEHLGEKGQLNKGVSGRASGLGSEDKTILGGAAEKDSGQTEKHRWQGVRPEPEGRE